MIQLMSLFVIPAFSCDLMGAAEMPESPTRLIPCKEIPVFFAIPLSWNGEKIGMTGSISKQQVWMNRYLKTINTLAEAQSAQSFSIP